MVQIFQINCIAFIGFLLLCVTSAHAEGEGTASENLLRELESSPVSVLEELVQKGNGKGGRHGYASYYAKRFEGRRTTSGQRYHPDKMTAAHYSLPLGTIVRVVNLGTSQEVYVTVNDRCARKSYPFIDLSRAAAKKIGLWGKGKIRVAIIPVLADRLEDPA